MGVRTSLTRGDHGAAEGRAVFTYGTLLIPSVMEAVTNRRFEAQAATLHDYARCQLRGRVYPGAFARPGASTTGLVYLDVDAASLARLDAFEGDCYRRCTVSVVRASGERLAAEAWIIHADFSGLLTDRAWNREHFEREFLSGYLDAIRRVDGGPAPVSGSE